MHLSAINPYVSSTLSDWRKKQSLAASVPRQAAPAPQLSSGGGDRTVGTSSFGMSGVNSHVLLRPAAQDAVPSDVTSHGCVAVVWQIACPQKCCHVAQKVLLLRS